jgi:hypothetical protein
MVAKGTPRHKRDIGHVATLRHLQVSHKSPMKHLGSARAIKPFWNSSEIVTGGEKYPSVRLLFVGFGPQIRMANQAGRGACDVVIIPCRTASCASARKCRAS